MKFRNQYCIFPCGNTLDASLASTMDSVNSVFLEIVFPVCVTIAIPGNIVAIIAWSRCRHIPISGYTLTLSVNDLVFTVLSTVQGFLLTYLNIDIYVVTTWLCPVLTFLSQTSWCVGYWILVALIVDRTVLTICHSRLRKYSQKQRSKIVCFVVVLASVVQNFYYLVFAERVKVHFEYTNYTDYQCQFSGQVSETLLAVETTTTFLFLCVFPFTTVGFCLLVLVVMCDNLPSRLETRMNQAAMLTGTSFLVFNLPNTLVFLDFKGLVRIDKALGELDISFWVFSCLSFSVYPFVYLIFTDYRETVKEIFASGFQRVCCRKTCGTSQANIELNE